MQFTLSALLLSTYFSSIAAPPPPMPAEVEGFATIKEVVENAVKQVFASKQEEKSLARQVLAYNPAFADKFGIRQDMSAEQVAKQLDRAVLRTRIGNGLVGGLVGAGAGAGYVKFNDWRQNYKKMQQTANGPTTSPVSDATVIPPPSSSNSTAA